jgi:hypothetical protein
MVWVVLVLAGVSWLVVVLISEQERGEVASLSSRFAAVARNVREAAPQAFGNAGKRSMEVLARLSALAIEAGRAFGQWTRSQRVRRRQARRSPVMAFGPQASARPVQLRARSAGEGLRSRLVALLQLILFVMLIGALVAGAVAAAALRIGHLGT